MKAPISRHPRILLLGVEAGIHTHRERDSIDWIVAKLTVRERPLTLDGDDPVFDGVLHHLGARL